MRDFKEYLSFLRLQGNVVESCLSTDNAVATGSMCTIGLTAFHWRRTNSIDNYFYWDGGPLSITDPGERSISYIDNPAQFVVILGTEPTTPDPHVYVTYIAGLNRHNTAKLKAHLEELPTYESLD